MYQVLKGLLSHFQSNAMPTIGLAILLFCAVGLLLSFGRRLEPAMWLERLGVPIALLVGLFALFIGPYGPLHLLPQSVTDIWIRYPTPLLTLVFATLMLGRPLPRGQGLWQPVASQALLGLLLGFGQYLVGGLAVSLFLIPVLGVDPLMGCLIEVGFEGGHGAAAVMGESFRTLGFPGGLDLGLAMATVGLLASTILGTVLVVIGRMRGWVVSQSSLPMGTTEELEGSTFWDRFRELTVNLGLVGAAVGFGVITLSALRFVAPWLGGAYSQVIKVFPVFPLALLGSLLIRLMLEKSGKAQLASPLLQREIGILATDLLIITATASLNLPLLQQDWVPLTVLSVAGLIWNLVGMLILSRFIIKEEWFERSLTEFGNATGVAASGLLLLRLADPSNVTSTLPVFSIKQLFLQPLLSGGLVTVIAPLAVSRLGLIGWTEICGILTMLFLIIALILPNYSPEEPVLKV